MADNNKIGRLGGFSDLINIEKLEHETRKLFFLGLLVAVFFHAVLASYFIFKKSEVKVIKPMTMELIIRKPRLTKPFEFKKERIQPRVLIKKTFKEKVIPSAEFKIKAPPNILAGRIISFEYNPVFDYKSENVGFYMPENIEIDLSIIKKPDNIISMKEEMINLDDLDTGRYKAMVIQDPKNKQNIKGFIYIGILWGTQFEPAYKRAVIHLSDGLNKYTRINSKVDKHLLIDSRTLLETPVVYLAANKKFELTEIEVKNFGNYLRNGGFAILDNGVPEKDFGPAESSLRWMIEYSLGNDAKFLPIPNNHPLYHCFFDFDDGPPIGAENEDNWTLMPGNYMARSTDQKQVYYLEGVWLGNRLVAIYSDKGYCKLWDSDEENEPQLRMGVNMVVFALIQEGGIAQKLMEFYTTGK